VQRSGGPLGLLSADNLEFVPWGWSRRAVALGRRTSPPSEVAVRAGNSRAWSFALEQELGIALSGAARIERFDDLATIVANSAHQWGDRPEEHHWVIKATFGMAARERILGCGLHVSDSHQSWMLRRLVSDGGLFFEPWLPIRAEVGLQFEVPPRAIGTPRLEGITPLLTDSQGHYRGSCFSRDEAVPEEWQPATEVAGRAAERLQELGYFGPLGIDAAQHELRTGDVLHRPLQDINARFTMGRLALGFQRLLRPAESGVWQHFMAHETITLDSSHALPVRVIPTSPSFVGGQRSEHRSAVVISKTLADCVEPQHFRENSFEKNGRER
jgi:hypothetical protein